MTNLLALDPLDAVQVRDDLKGWVATNKGLGDDHFFINELGFYNKVDNQRPEPAFRADLVCVTNKLVGFEIKSEKDSLKRWEDQKIAYSNVFCEVWLCAHHKHLKKALSTTPSHIGIVVIDAENKLELLRGADEDHGMNNTYDLSSMLWREELDELALLHGVEYKKRTNKKQVREILAVELTHDQVMAFVISKLNTRKNKNILAD